MTKSSSQLHKKNNGVSGNKFNEERKARIKNRQIELMKQQELNEIRMQKVRSQQETRTRERSKPQVKSTNANGPPQNVKHNVLSPSPRANPKHSESLDFNNIP